MVELRPLREEDAGALFPLWEGSGLGHAEFAAAIAERVRLEEAGLLRACTVWEVATGQLAGTIRIVYRQGWGEIGLWLGREFQGRGLGGEAIEQMQEMGFGELGLSRIEARIVAGNEASRRAFAGRGFRLREIQSRAQLEGGTWRDVLVLEARRSDFGGR
jgi:RimJ/RimL family protein N-acetyltransferase